jgi:hypothetical protein
LNNENRTALTAKTAGKVRLLNRHDAKTPRKTKQEFNRQGAMTPKHEGG